MNRLNKLQGTVSFPYKRFSPFIYICFCCRSYYFFIIYIQFQWQMVWLHSFHNTKATVMLNKRKKIIGKQQNNYSPYFQNYTWMYKDPVGRHYKLHSKYSIQKWYTYSITFPNEFNTVSSEYHVVVVVVFWAARAKTSLSLWLVGTSLAVLLFKSPHQWVIK